MVRYSSHACYKNPIHKLVRFFEQSRNSWKAKHKATKIINKRLENKVRFLTKSRDSWKEETLKLRKIAKTQKRAKQRANEEEPPKKNFEIINTPKFEEKIPFHQYSVGHIRLFIDFILLGATSLRGGARCLEVIKDFFGVKQKMPSWYSGRLWLMRIGLYLLNRPKEIADDWIWIVDHTVKIGCEKCFVILGIRQRDLPKKGKCLQHKDLELIGLFPVKKSNGDIVCGQLEKAAKITGEPRAILSDKGSDINSGVSKYIEKHILVGPLYDIAHKVACLLKKQLHENTRWNEFTAFANKVKNLLQQTSLAHLRPPKQRSKARYMNISPLVTWAQRVLFLVTNPNQTDEDIKAKLGGIIEFKEEISAWSEMILVCDQVLHYMRTQYLEFRTKIKLRAYLKKTLSKFDSAMGGAMQKELLKFVGEQQAECYDSEEKLISSSEVIESIFGKQKYIESDQSGNGFTGLILAIGTIVSTLSDDVIKKAMASVSTKNLIEWCKNNIGETVQAKRNGFFSKPIAE